MSENINRVTLVALDMADPAASVRDPAFSALMEQGYTVQASLPAMRGNKQEWMMLLSKQQTGPESPMPVTMNKTDRLLLLAAVSVQTVTCVLVLASMFGG
jgi:hypothetical protein